VNYFEHHIGDYDQATAHLTACEDGIYCRLIRWYMASEAPLPPDIAAIQRRVRAHSKDEKAAVESVLSEFFDLQDDGYRQHRCDEELAKFHASAPERDAKRENSKERQRRTRERRKAIFLELREAGVVPPFDAKMHELEAELSRVKSRVTSQHVTRDATATHFPVPTTQSPEQKQELPPTAGASQPKDPDPIFGSGLEFLVRKGVTEKGARGFLGLMRKDCGDLLTIELLLKAEKDDVSDPVAWLRAAGKARAGPPNGKRPPVNASFAGKDYSIGATPDDELFDFGPH